MKRFILGVALVFTVASSSHAGLLVTSGVDGTIPGGSAKNELIDPVLDFVLGDDTYLELDGQFGAEISVGANVKSLKFTFYGAEAFFDNSFIVNTSAAVDPVTFAHTFDGLSVFTDTAPMVSYDVDDLDLTGPLFSFTTPRGPVTSLDNPDNDPKKVNYFTSVLSHKDIIVWLDDTGAGDDDNHDDMVVRITAVIPEPGTMSMVLCGLAAAGGLGLRRRR